MGVHPAPHLGRASRVPVRGLAALPARREPRLRSGVRALEGVPGAAARQARHAGLHLVVRASLLRRDPLPPSRHQPRHRAAAGARFESSGTGDQPGPDRLVRGEAVVKRIVVGAHYGTGSWLALRITAVSMALYSVIALVVVFWGKPLSYAVL